MYLWSITEVPAANRKVFANTIVLHNAKESDSAVYQCEASNRHGTLLSNANIMIMSKYDRFQSTVFISFITCFLSSTQKNRLTRTVIIRIFVLQSLWVSVRLCTESFGDCWLMCQARELALTLAYAHKAVRSPGKEGCLHTVLLHSGSWSSQWSNQLSSLPFIC